MKKLIRPLLFALLPVVLASCSHKKVEVPSNISIDDISALLQAKEIDVDALEAYLPAFTDQYTAQVEDFLNNHTPEQGEALGDISQSVADAIEELKIISTHAEPDTKLIIDRCVMKIERMHNRAGQHLGKSKPGKGSTASSSSVNPYSGNYAFTGTIGGYSNATLYLNDGSGTYTLSGHTRDVSINSYDASSGSLTVDAYLNGSYIGYFSGKLRGGHYEGIFYNTRSGGRVNFSLYL